MKTRTVIVALSLAALAACGGGQQRSEQPAPPAAALNIPPGYIPSAGKCRHWYPSKPLAQQPPVGECAALQKNIPSGAFLVRG